MAGAKASSRTGLRPRQLAAQSIALSAALTATGLLTAFDNIQRDPSHFMRLVLVPSHIPPLPIFSEHCIMTFTESHPLVRVDEQVTFVGAWSLAKLATGQVHKVPRFLFAWPPGALLVHFLSVCAGTPIFRGLSQTGHFSALLGAFLVLPLVDNSHVDTRANVVTQWLSGLNAQGMPKGGCPSTTSATLQIYSTVLGCLCGMWPLPMDWAKPWQVWPTSVMLGAVCGNALGQVLAATVGMTHPKATPSGKHDD
eukprot:CAMPEP_0177769246 /NCGR_PEP_ID=MMETSP0491_2-20121128/10208_1 /TAXON_ID=63592 /ORGANISM="Tetraselmis chuii, Strain PLY429" /LENGTH=252 /DNA_ID=CAMNT_0019286219 /DNA_START=95 /DNA_END=853 /DNA_ORIENTATION=+